MLIQGIAVVLVLSAILMIHELGHFLSARSIGVAVQEFSIGIGPAVWKKKGKKSLYAVRCLPFGGYCLFDPHAEGTDSRGRPLSMAARGAFYKIYITIAGPILNFVLAAALFTLVFSVLGMTVGYEPVVGTVNPESPAMEAGILPGDRILAIDGEGLHTWYDLTRILSGVREPGEMRFDLRRGADDLSLTVKPIYYPEENRSMIGVIVDARNRVTERFSPLQGIRMGLSQTMALIGSLFGAIGAMVSGQMNVSENLSGPIALMQIIGETASDGLSDTIFLTAFLSVNLGIMNLLPLPALDGGRIIMYLVEFFRRKPLTAKVEGWINATGFALLILLMVWLTFKDIFAFFAPN